MNGTGGNDELRRIIDDQHRMGEQADAALRLGTMLMEAGTGGYRIIRAMKRAARAMGFDRVDAVISVNNITATFHRDDTFRTVVANRDTPAVDASRIEALENLSRDLGGPDSGLEAEELNRQLDHVEQFVTKRWAVWIQALAAGMACAGFAVLNHYSLPGAAAVAVSAALGQVIRHMCARRHVNQLGTTAVAAVASCLIYAGLAQLLVLTGIIEGPSFTVGYVTAVLFLMPGFPLFSSLLDLGRFDLAAGMSRLGYALTIIFTATMSASAVSLITGLQPLPERLPEYDGTWYIAAAVASAVGVAGFALLFNSSRRMALVAALTGTVANMVRMALLELGLAVQVATFLGALVVGLLGALVARPMRLPRITVTVPAAIIMIPGPAVFTTVYSLNVGDVTAALTSASTAVLSILAIGSGLIVARMLTDPAWTFGRHIDLVRPT